MQVKQRGYAFKVCSYLLLCPLLHRVDSFQVHTVMSEEELHDPWDSNPTQGVTRQKECERMVSFPLLPKWQDTELMTTCHFSWKHLRIQHNDSNTHPVQGVSLIPGAETRRITGGRPCPGAHLGVGVRTAPPRNAIRAEDKDNNAY